MKAKTIKVGTSIYMVFILIYSQQAFAQHDTTFYTQYRSMFGFGLYEEIRNNSLYIERTGVTDSTQPHSIKYNTNGQRVTGLILNYDKIYVAFGIKTENREVETKGKSSNTNLALKLHGNKLLVEATYRNYRGFYDENTFVNDTLLKDTAYYRDESLRNKTIKLKSFYFLNNKKFSYNAAYFGSQRQLKSAASWVLNANFYIANISSDSSIIPYYAREAFIPYSYIKRINVTAFSVGGGGSANVVIFKRLFFNATFTMGLEPQWRTYTLVDNREVYQSVLSATLDFRSALGYNSERFFVLFTSVNDLTVNSVKELVFTTNFLSGAFIIGYRFPLENGATRALKENKIYQAF